MMPELVSGGAGKPEQGPANLSVLGFLRECSSIDLEDPGEDWDWPEAFLPEVVHYLRGSKLLSMPPALKAVFPSRV